MIPLKYLHPDGLIKITGSFSRKHVLYQRRISCRLFHQHICGKASLTIIGIILEFRTVRIVKSGKISKLSRVCVVEWTHSWRFHHYSFFGNLFSTFNFGRSETVTKFRQWNCGVEYSLRMLYQVVRSGLQEDIWRLALIKGKEWDMRMIEYNTISASIIPVSLD